jgi:hypothetical protein
MTPPQLAVDFNRSCSATVFNFAVFRGQFVIAI